MSGNRREAALGKGLQNLALGAFICMAAAALAWVRCAHPIQYSMTLALCAMIIGVALADVLTRNDTKPQPRGQEERGGPHVTRSTSIAAGLAAPAVAVALLGAGAMISSSSMEAVPHSCSLLGIKDWVAMALEFAVWIGFFQSACMAVVRWTEA
jgi:hypothetical protein